MFARSLGLFAIVLVSACASSQSTENTMPLTGREKVAFGGIESVDFYREGRVRDAELTGSRAAVWNALLETHEGLGLKRVQVDASNALLVSNARVMRTFAGKPASRFFDCGSTLTGLRADSYQLDVSVGQQVDSIAPNKARLRTLVDASASSVGASGGAVRCDSTGELEKLIAAAVGARL